MVELEEVTSPASRETVETVFECSRLWVTGLKPGVNEMGAFRLLRQRRRAAGNAGKKPGLHSSSPKERRIFTFGSGGEAFEFGEG